LGVGVWERGQGLPQAGTPVLLNLSFWFFDKDFAYMAVI